MSQNPRTILIIDDEPGVSRVLTLLLSRARFRVLAAGEGETGCALAEKEMPCLIFCDERMPGLDGAKTLEMLKANPVTSEIPVVMMGGTHVEGLRNWVAEGAAGFIAKPFAVAELMAMVRRLVSEEPTPAR